MPGKGFLSKCRRKPTQVETHTQGHTHTDIGVGLTEEVLKAFGVTTLDLTAVVFGLTGRRRVT